MTGMRHLNPGAPLTYFNDVGGGGGADEKFNSGRKVFHIPWCPDYISLIQSRFCNFVFTFVFYLPTSHGKKKFPKISV